jgi:hypothetical protein
MKYENNKNLSQDCPDYGPPLIDTLEDIAFARARELIRRGVNEGAAWVFAFLEIAERRELGARIGTDAALLAKVEWRDDGEGHFHCALVPDQQWRDFGKGEFLGFQDDYVPDDVDV